MKAATTPMKAHIFGEVTTLATLWLLEQNTGGIAAVAGHTTLAPDTTHTSAAFLVPPTGTMPKDAMVLSVANREIYFLSGVSLSSFKLVAFNVETGVFRQSAIINGGEGGKCCTDDTFIYGSGENSNSVPIYKWRCSDLVLVAQNGTYSGSLAPTFGSTGAVQSMHIWNHPNGHQYLASQGLFGRVAVFDTGSFASAPTAFSGVVFGKQMATDSSGILWALSQSGTEVLLQHYDPSTFTATDHNMTTALPGGAEKMTYNASTNSLIIASSDGLHISSVDATTLAVTTVAIASSDPAWGQSAYEQGVVLGNLWLVNGSSFYQINASTLTVTQTFSEFSWNSTGTTFSSLYDPLTNCLWIQENPGLVQYCMGQVATPPGTGTSIGFTDHDRDILYNGVTYIAHDSGERSNVRNSATLAVDNLEIVGVFEGDGISKEDVRAGKWDYATVKVFMVNWNDLTMGDIKLRKGRIGQVSLSDQEYKTELRGLSDEFSRVICEVTTPDCRADLFDARCKLNADAFKKTGTVSQLVTFNDPTDPTSGINTLPDTSGSGTTTPPPPPTGTGGGTPVPIDSSGFPVVGSATTLTLETGNNSSAFSDYDKTSAITEIHANFTGITHIDAANVAKDDAVYDDSLNETVPNLTQVSVLAGGNVSKVPIKSLLYAGCTAKMFMHFMLWWKNPKTDHINIGYTSDTTTQVARQVADIKSRGWDAIIPSWYGNASIPASGHAASYDDTTKLIKAECERRGDMEFAISVEHGAIQDSTNKQQDLITLLNYVADTYYISPKYARLNSRPVLHFFGLEIYNSQLNWTTIRGAIRGNPLFIFRNRSGFNNYGAGQADGAFSWLDPSSDTATDPSDLGYLNDFYSGAKLNSGKIAFGDGFKGFNGTMTYSTAWSDRKNIAADNGRTWLRSLRLINNYYNSSNQIAAIMGVTWNDWEEGTALEPGIENAVVVTATVTTDTLTWTVTGGAGLLSGSTSEDTVHHYTVLYGTDGVNFTVLTNLTPSAAKSVALATLLASLPAATYKLRVKATGHPNIRNKMSNEVSWVKASSPTPTPTSGAALYVATTGSDSNPGTQASPFQTIGFAATKATPGTTVFVANGTYPGTIRTNVSGSSTQRIVFKSTNKWGAHIVGVSGSDRVWDNEGSFVDIVGFEVSGVAGNQLGILNMGSNVSIRRNHVHDIPAVFNSNGGAGIDHANYLATNNDTIANWVHNIGVDAPGGNSAVHGIYHAMFGGRIQSNLIYHVPGYGIQLWHAANAVVVENNTCFNCSSGILVGTGDSPGGITIDNCYIANNISRNNIHWGIVEDWTGSGGIGPNMQYVNNDVFANPTGGIDNQVSTHVSGTKTVDPLMVNWQLDGSGDYHLTTASPCKDTGTSTNAPSIDLDGGARPVNGAFDIGCYEYGSVPSY